MGDRIIPGCRFLQEVLKCAFYVQKSELVDDMMVMELFQRSEQICADKKRKRSNHRQTSYKCIMKSSLALAWYIFSKT